MKFKSDPRDKKLIPSEIVDFLSSKELKFNWTNGKKELLSENAKTSIHALIENNILKENAKLQNKIDYYITPYNSKINVQSSMEFGDKDLNCNLQDIAKKDWKLVSDFVLLKNK